MVEQWALRVEYTIKHSFTDRIVFRLGGFLSPFPSSQPYVGLKLDSLSPGVNVFDGMKDKARKSERGTILPNFHLTKKFREEIFRSQHFFLLTLYDKCATHLS